MRGQPFPARLRELGTDFKPWYAYRQYPIRPSGTFPSRGRLAKRESRVSPAFVHRLI